MGMWARLCFELNRHDTFLALRVCACTTESIVLARANGIDAGR